MANKINRRRRLYICNVIVWHVTSSYCVSPKERDAIYQRPSLAFSQKEGNKHETQNIRIMTPNKVDRRYLKDHQNRGMGMGIPSSRNAGLVVYIINREHRNEI
ncbi:hypothetical protein ASPVEDRAFT_585816 [Aspergillus versicolor CBS 583.65]|uniref:Uncharacterized protein n=1 Tax=Aspergillus versicolor CBS 583.65 TaxID=1036611 RepID=A0A1L9PGQ5_ASPVE|nr:uncharacterized protein ASPVEDRAFT_585816 [Aspergillus versicolor CBS 583.65]OJJ00653.1 hypothetical protein ASPVEDRAFT_585816 [Aspergillus versicolor CBS 583.65]